MVSPFRVPFQSSFVILRNAWGVGIWNWQKSRLRGSSMNKIIGGQNNILKFGNKIRNDYHFPCRFSPKLMSFFVWKLVNPPLLIGAWSISYGFFSADFIATIHRRLVTANGGDCKGISPKCLEKSGLGIVVICPGAKKDCETWQFNQTDKVGGCETSGSQ